MCHGLQWTTSTCAMNMWRVATLIIDQYGGFKLCDCCRMLGHRASHVCRQKCTTLPALLALASAHGLCQYCRGIGKWKGCILFVCLRVSLRLACGSRVCPWARTSLGPGETCLPLDTCTWCRIESLLCLLHHLYVRPKGNMLCLLYTKYYLDAICYASIRSCFLLTWMSLPRKTRFAHC